MATLVLVAAPLGATATPTDAPASSGLVGRGGAQVPGGLSGQPGTASWVWPLQPRPAVVRGFDPPDQRWGAGHRGVDLAGHAGQIVHAAGAGVVTFAGMLAGSGVVTVSHGALRTTYEPVDATVSVGDQVAAGASIGTLELIGGHCLPEACLHWGLLRGKTYLDPLSLVGAGPVRLLPLGAVPAVTGGAAGPARPPRSAAHPTPATSPSESAELVARAAAGRTAAGRVPWRVAAVAGFGLAATSGALALGSRLRR